jgi:hypothetical protein
MEEVNLPMSAMGKASMSPPEAVAQAVLKSIRRDKAEIVVMPGPGRLVRALMTLFPAMGPAMNQMTGSTRTMKQVADFRELQREQLNANNSHSVEQR